MKLKDEKFFEQERERLKVKKREEIRKLIDAHINNKRVKSKKMEYKKRFRALKRTEKQTYTKLFNYLKNGNTIY